MTVYEFGEIGRRGRIGKKVCQSVGASRNGLARVLFEKLQLPDGTPPAR